LEGRIGILRESCRDSVKVGPLGELSGVQARLHRGHFVVVDPDADAAFVRQVPHG
jgi:hypothetical protein